MKGICDKKMYEHCAPHYRIPERGQTLPPFPCQNWRPLDATIEAQSKKIEIQKADWNQMERKREIAEIEVETPGPWRFVEPTQPNKQED